MSRGRLRHAPRLALGQIRYQLLLLVRNPLGFFLALVVPLLLVLCLNLLTPGSVTADNGVPYAEFLTPAIGTFCLLNACYVNTITGLVLAREQGILKRLRGTPLPMWTYLFGRLGSAFVTGATALAVLVAVGVAFFGVTIDSATIGYVAGVASLAMCCFFLLGVAVSTLVPSAETALPVAYGTMLPLAFISDVFFSSAHAPQWLHDLASALPVAPVARAMEDTFRPDTHGWPMSGGAMLVMLGWALGSAVTAALLFRWSPGPWRRDHRAPRWHPRHSATVTATTPPRP